MRKIFNFFFCCLVFSAVSVSLSGQGIVLKQSAISGIYKKGNIITVTAYTGNNKGDSLHVRVLKNNYTELMNSVMLIESDSLLVFRGAFDDPCSVMIEARVKDEYTALGFMVTPGKLKPGGSRPEDFDKFWEAEKQNLKSLPLDIKTSPVENSRS